MSQSAAVEAFCGLFSIFYIKFHTFDLTSSIPPHLYLLFSLRLYATLPSRPRRGHAWFVLAQNHLMFYFRSDRPGHSRVPGLEHVKSNVAFSSIEHPPVSG